MKTLSTKQSEQTYKTKESTLIEQRNAFFNARKGSL